MPIRDEHISLDRLLPDNRNPKQHSAENIKRLVSRIQAVGFTSPVLVDEKTGTLCAGHRRRLALLWLRENNFVEPSGIEPGWLVPCRVGSWTEIQALQVLVGDNEDPAEISFDPQALTALLAELEQQGELAGSGYDEARLDELLTELAAAAPQTPESLGEQEWPALETREKHQITLWYVLEDEEALKWFIGQDDDSPLEPKSAGTRIVKRIKERAAAEADPVGGGARVP